MLSLDCQRIPDHVDVRGVGGDHQVRSVQRHLRSGPDFAIFRRKIAKIDVFLTLNNAKFFICWIITWVFRNIANIFRRKFRL
jgi:hypothetical protein